MATLMLGFRKLMISRGAAAAAACSACVRCSPASFLPDSRLTPCATLGRGRYLFTAAQTQPNEH